MSTRLMVRRPSVLLDGTKNITYSVDHGSENECHDTQTFQRTRGRNGNSRRARCLNEQIKEISSHTCHVALIVANVIDDKCGMG